MESALEEAMDRLGINKNRQTQLRESTVKLREILDENEEIDMTSEQTQNNIDEMDSMLYKFSTTTATAGGATTSFSTFDSVSSNENSLIVDTDDEKKHKEISQKLTKMREDLKSTWENNRKAKSNVANWARDLSINR